MLNRPKLKGKQRNCYFLLSPFLRRRRPQPSSNLSPPGSAPLQQRPLVKLSLLGLTKVKKRNGYVFAINEEYQSFRIGGDGKLHGVGLFINIDPKIEYLLKLLNGKVDERELLVSDLQKKRQKLEDALAAAKKLKSQQ